MGGNPYVYYKEVMVINVNVQMVVTYTQYINTEKIISIIKLF